MSHGPIKVLSRESEHRPGTPEAIPSLTRCQVSTPRSVVDLLWTLVRERRPSLSTVLDLGAGDGRFAWGQGYEQYLGVEIDPRRVTETSLSADARILIGCALDIRETFDAVLGNPPYIRNQDMSDSWRSKASRLIERDLGVRPDRRSNAYLYFFWLALARATTDGLCALVIPTDWVWRPSAASLRDFLRERGWSVDVYELSEDVARFGDVRTTATISIVDKSALKGQMAVFNQVDSEWRPLDQAYSQQILPRSAKVANVFARRGLSTGSQAVFVLRESERRAAGIKRSECLPCVTSLRGLDANMTELNRETFDFRYVEQNRRCWLLRTDQVVSHAVKAWLDGAPGHVKSNSTCQDRKLWYRYTSPRTPRILYSSGFCGSRPTFLLNSVRVCTVGAVHGIFTPARYPHQQKLLEFLRRFDFGSRLIPHHGGLRKLDVRQMNGLLNNFCGDCEH